MPSSPPSGPIGEGTCTHSNGFKDPKESKKVQDLCIGFENQTRMVPLTLIASFPLPPLKLRAWLLVPGWARATLSQVWEAEIMASGCCCPSCCSNTAHSREHQSHHSAWTQCTLSCTAVRLFILLFFFPFWFETVKTSSAFNIVPMEMNLMLYVTGG